MEKSKKRILFIDDNEANIKVAKGAFSEISSIELESCFKESFACMNDIDDGQYDLIFLKDKTENFANAHALRSQTNYKEKPLILIVELKNDEAFLPLMDLDNIEIISEPIHVNQLRFRSLAMLKSYEYRENLQNLVDGLEHEVKEKTKNLLDSEKQNAVLAMIATYNHEINNPLTIAMGNLGKGLDNLNEKKFERIHESLVRIQNVLKEIKNIEKKSDLDFKDYIKDGPQIIDLKGEGND